MKYVNRPLFGGVKITKKLKYEIIQSERDGFVSIIDFNETTDRFKLKQGGYEYACKFYNKDKDEFIGASYMAMWNLNRYFDRKIIKEEHYL